MDLKKSWLIFSLFILIARVNNKINFKEKKLKSIEPRTKRVVSGLFSGYIIIIGSLKLVLYILNS